LTSISKSVDHISGFIFIPFIQIWADRICQRRPFLSEISAQTPLAQIAASLSQDHLPGNDATWLPKSLLTQPWDSGGTGRSELTVQDGKYLGRKKENLYGNGNVNDKNEPGPMDRTTH
jgi:hypothetical protein